MNEQSRSTPAAAGSGATRATGRGGMPTVALRDTSGATAELYLHGAHLTSWRAADRVERLFLSEHARFQPDAGIRGGIPIVFPQFGPGPLPQHGFARQREWTLVDLGTDRQGRAVVRLALDDSAETRALWPYAFHAELTVRLLANALDVELAVTNAGNEPWEFTAALHSYFRVPHIEGVRVRGLQGSRFRDKTRDGITETEQESALRIRRETDRVYLRTPSVLHLDGVGDGGTLRLEKHGLADAVVWNPWAEWARKRDDFGDTEYLRMVCVEAAQIGDPVRLAPRERWVGRQILSPEGAPDA